MSRKSSLTQSFRRRFAQRSWYSSVRFRRSCDSKISAIRSDLIVPLKVMGATSLWRTRGTTEAVGIQHVLQYQYSFQFMDIRAADHGQSVEMCLAHSFERQIQGLVRKCSEGKFREVT